MADKTEENKFISKINSGFPDYLDWAKLRDEGRTHLGNLAGEIWTDHNVHDPGITILEMLCYAMMDLGYRTNLPPADIFARDPNDTTNDPNFFTPAQILVCNPVTITDFRKMLVDIEGIKNAWLKVADDISTASICGQNKTVYDTDSKEYCCAYPFYNGLYHVYVELEKDYDPVKDKVEYDELIDKIRNILMSHRNLCEDFIDIYVLCKAKIGLCADIELERGADAETVYKNVVEALRNFFSPSPKFYTLRQMLEEKNKNIEDVFAGRPYNLKESHGFVDSEEFEEIKLRKEIHLSDVYSVIFKVEGVRAVRNLGWKNNCGVSGDKASFEWKWNIPENSIPDFSPDCSNIKFERNGITVPYNAKKFASFFEMDFRHNGKVLYTTPSPYLDSEFPKGNYHKDLGEYLSIQNEFPRVYGIAEGGLPDDASDLRKAQALQLKAYLLFFDQLLANYASQLKNIRSLFSAQSGNERHTYFLNQLSDVPDLQKLLRFKANETGTSQLGELGTLLAIPVKATDINELINKIDINETICEINFVPYQFCNLNECETEINIFIQSLLYGNYKAKIKSDNHDCWFFYFTTQKDDIAFVSNKFYKSEKEAGEAAASVQYAGTFEKNYRSFITKDSKFSFSLELNLIDYTDYLQLILEDRYLYEKRREDFLNHLLSRFAEKFTDFALLSFGTLDQKTFLQKEIEAKENFLTHYDDLSANRGRAYDYKLNGWNNENISGFEKRVAALSGTNDWRRHYLCNFVVEEKEEELFIIIKFLDEMLFADGSKYFSQEAAEQSAKDFLNALRKKENFEIKKEHDRCWRIKIKCNDQNLFYKRNIENEAEAKEILYGLQTLFSNEPSEKDVEESKWDFKIIVRDSSNQEVAISSKFLKEANAKKIAADPKKYIEEQKNLIYQKENFKPFENIYPEKNDSFGFFDRSAFKIKTDNDIVGVPDKFEFEILDKENNFKFISSGQFETVADAEDACNKLLSQLIDFNSFLPIENKNGKFTLQIKTGDVVLAESETEYENKTQANRGAQEISAIVKQHRYFISCEKLPSAWNFKFLIGYEKNQQYAFHSSINYNSRDEAKDAAKKFHGSFEAIKIKSNAKQITLYGNVKNMECVYEIDQSKTGKAISDKISKLLELKKEYPRILNSKSTKTLSSLVTNEIGNPLLKYVYRLVDKDNLQAVYLGTEYNKCEKAEEEKKILFQGTDVYEFTEICYGGDIINEVPDEITKATWYHYQIKCTNKNLPADANVLFESVQGYSSREDAIKAFNEKLFDILTNARFEKNYGTDECISLEVIRIHERDDCTNLKSIVFVPDITFEKLSSHHNDVLKSKLVKLMNQYPVRRTTKLEDEFYTLFPCEKDERGSSKNNKCIDLKNPPVEFYYFVLSDKEGKAIWLSVKYFKTSNEASERFYFFLLLLWYPGNYTVLEDLCECKWKIYIREVLAESKERFKGTSMDALCKVESEEAWKAVEKFICVSQTEKSFHTYRDRDQCYYSFNVGCDNLGLIHPCTYDTVEKRDEAIEKLVAGFNGYAKFEIPKIEKKESQCLIINLKNEPFAFFKSSSKDRCICLADIVEQLLYHSYTIKEKYISVNFEKTSIDIHPLNEQSDFYKWVAEFFDLVCYYPVRKKKEDEYVIELNLPGFNCCKDDFSELELCGCGKNKNEDDDCKCCTAWQSDCCFKTCEEAISFLTKNKDCLLNYSNYLPVFECDCGPYGIKLDCNCPEFTRPVPDNPGINIANIPPSQDNSQVEKQNCCSEIIAFNPQHYETPKMDCDAVKRAKKLINTEGLHLVEHILLRPRCVDHERKGECKCPIKVCDEPTKSDANFTVNYQKALQKIDNCCWEWKESGEADPCDEDDPNVCFAPGNDPYSFIATIALPSWSARFNKKENRLLVENLLYREAPAHVLLRILWLAPKDFCTFESYTRKWNHWISKPNSIGSCYNPTCEFIDFLFEKQFECLEECNECIPCQDENPKQPDCFEPEKNDCCDATVLYNINHLFCWEQYECNEKEKYTEPKEESNGNTGEVILLKKKFEKKAEKIKEVKTKEKVFISSKEAADFFNTRRGNFITHVTLELASTKKEQLKNKLHSFFNKPKPTSIDFFDSLFEIKKQFTTGKQAAGTTPLKAIKENIICFFLDKIFTGMAVVENETEFAELFKKELKQINAKRMLKTWDYPSIKEKGIENNHALIGKLLDGLINRSII